MEMTESLRDNTGTQGNKANLLFGELLVSKGILSRRELTEALKEQRDNGGRLGEVLVRLGMLKDEDITIALGEHLSMDRIHFDDIDSIDKSVARLLPNSPISPTG